MFNNYSDGRCFRRSTLDTESLEAEKMWYESREKKFLVSKSAVGDGGICPRTHPGARHPRGGGRGGTFETSILYDLIDRDIHRMIQLCGPTSRKKKPSNPALRGLPVVIDPMQGSLDPLEPSV